MKKSYQEKMLVQDWMLKALLALMEEAPFEKITVTQITQKAGVPRMTFYRNFKSKDHILENYSEYLTEELAHIFRLRHVNTAKEYFEIQLDFLLRHEGYLQALVKNHKEHIILDTINRNVDSMGFGAEETFIIKYYAGGIYNMMFSWLQSKENNDWDILLTTTFRLIDPALFEKAIQRYVLSFTKLR